MKQPNQRYGNPREFAHYTQGRSVKSIARELRRSERSVRDWLTGRQRVPWWVPEIFRLKNFEHDVRMQQMGIHRAATRLGMVSASVAELRSGPAMPPVDFSEPSPPVSLRNVA